MAFFDELGKKLSKTSQSAVQRTKDATEIARLNSLIYDEEKACINYQAEIGRLYIQLHSADFEPQFGDLINKVRESEGRIAAAKKQVQSLKGVKLCKVCGAELNPMSKFCSECGTVVKEEVIAIPGTDMVKCSSCGAMMQKNKKFCTSCGSKMNEDAVSGAVIDPIAPQPVPGVPEMPPVPVQTAAPTMQPAVPEVPAAPAPEAAEAMSDISATVFADNLEMKKKCPSCGAEQNAELKFCTNCGTKMDTAAASPVTPEQTPAAAENADAEAPEDEKAEDNTNTEKNTDNDDGKKKCPSCGSMQSADLMFCTSCGSSMDAEQSEPVGSFGENLAAAVSPEPEKPAENKPDEESKPSKKCYRCGNEQPADLKFCTKCGIRMKEDGEKKPLQLKKESPEPPAEEKTESADISPVEDKKTLKCPTCGNEQPEDLKFCTSCGNRMDAEPATQFVIFGQNAPDALAGMLPDLNKPEPEGEKLRECPYCGKKQASKLIYCKNCGRKLEEMPPIVTPPPIPSPNPEQKPVLSPAPAGVETVFASVENNSAKSEKEPPKQKPALKLTKEPAPVQIPPAQIPVPPVIPPAPAAQTDNSEKKICRSCGHAQGADLMFCTRCGMRMETARKPLTLQKESTPAAPVTPEAPAAPAPSSFGPMDRETVYAEQETVVPGPTDSSMNKCASCGNTQPAELRFCTKCGRKMNADKKPKPAVGPNEKNDFDREVEVTQVALNPNAVVKPGSQKCPACGNIQSVNLKFCVKCGKKLNSGASADRQKTTEPKNAPSAVVFGANGSQSALPCLVAKKTGEKIQISKSVFNLGRAQEGNDHVILNNKYVGHHHCHIISRNGEYFVVDDKSKNHTFIDGVMIPADKEIKITHGQILKLANEEFEFKVL